MDKLVSHAIRMLEIVEGENDFFRNDAKRQADIARAVYDTILRVQVLERKADRKTEPSGYKMKPVEQTEPQIEYCPRCGMRILVDKPKDEPQTESFPQKWTDWCKECGKKDRCVRAGFMPQCYESEDEPQTDCSWK